MIRAAITLAMLIAAICGNGASLRIFDAGGGYAATLRDAALRYALDGSGDVAIDTGTPAEALRRLNAGEAELILIAEDALPENFTGCVWRYFSEPLIIYVNSDNPLRELTSADVTALLTDERPSWSRFTGARAEIHRLALRRGDAGQAVRSRLLDKKNAAASIRELHSTGAGVLLLETDPAALLFGAWLDAVPIEVTALTIDGTLPLRKNIAGGRYPLAVRRVFAAGAEPAADAENFLRLLDTGDNRRELTDSGRFPLDMHKQTIRKTEK